MVLATFAETKVARLPGRTPASQKSTMRWEVGKIRSDAFTNQRFSRGIFQDTFPLDILLLCGQNPKFRMIQRRSEASDVVTDGAWRESLHGKAVEPSAADVFERSNPV